MQRRKSGVYEYRKMLPLGLRGLPAPPFIRSRFGEELINPQTGCFKRELSISLGTSDFRTAKRLDIWHASRVEGLLQEVTKALTSGDNSPLPLPTEEDWKTLLNELRADLIKSDHGERELGDDRRHAMTPEERKARWPLLIDLSKGPDDFGMELDHWLILGDVLEEELEALRNALSRRDGTQMAIELQIRLRKAGLQIPPKRELQPFVMKALEVAIATYEELLGGHKGGRVVSIDTPVGEELGVTLSEAFRLWRVGGGGRGAKKPSPSSVMEAEWVIRRWVELLGDLRLGAVQKLHVRKFREALTKLPKALPEDLQKLTLPLLLKKDLSRYSLRASATINKNLGLLGAIYSYAAKEGLTGGVEDRRSPFEDMKIALDDRGLEDNSRQNFEASDLKALFGHPIFTKNERPQNAGGGEAIFWFPLIGLFTGMRLGEIAALTLGDLRLDEASGVWVFEVKPSSKRLLKTQSSRRTVPVHSELVRMGLITYHHSLLSRSSPSDPLWPEVRFDEERQSAPAYSKLFRRLIGKSGIKGRKVFHSFRHSFKRFAREALLPEDISDALTGHSGGGVGRTYGSGFSITTLSQAIEKIRPPVDLGAVTWSPASSSSSSPATKGRAQR